MLPSRSLPPLECCFGTSPIQAEKLRPDRKVLGSATLATRAVASPGNVMKALARLVGPVPGHDHPIELQDLLLEAEQLSAERGKTRTGNLWHPLACAVKHQAAPLLRRLGWHEPHGCRGDGLANR